MNFKAEHSFVSFRYVYTSYNNKIQLFRSKIPQYFTRFIK